MKTFVQTLAAVVVALMTVSVARATTIWFEDFENPSITSEVGGSYLTDWFDPWGHVPQGGGYGDPHVVQPTSAEFNLPLSSPAGGMQIQWVSQTTGGDGMWAARSGGAIAANTQYSLSAAIGRRLLTCNPASSLWHLQLYAGTTTSQDTLLAEIAYSTSGANLPTAGNWAANSVTFDSTGSSHVGETLWARLYTGPGLGYDDNGYFDNVKLTATPEPGTCVMLLAAISALGLYALRRRN